ncbi:MAG: DUF1616 domain-containing protein, partial [Chloroflexota bacterium]|nr:DUF1616 domain-containing protein [Chloroflexota bacterium]
MTASRWRAAWLRAASGAMSLPARPGMLRATFASAAIAGALLAAYLVPPLAIVVVWPLLFFVPGWIAVRALNPRLAVPARAGLAVVLSVAVSSHLVYWLALLAGGYRRETVFAASVVLAVPVAWA